MSLKKNQDKNMKKVQNYLNKLKIPFKLDEMGRVQIGWKIQDGVYITSISIFENFLSIYATIMLREELKGADLKGIYELLLRASHDIPEVVFELDKDGNIATSQEIPLDALNFKVFKSELNAIPGAIVCFLDNIVPEFGLKVK